MKNFKFFEKFTFIKFLSLDIEGMDFEVLYNQDLQKFDIENISFEHLHLSFGKNVKSSKNLLKMIIFSAVWGLM